MASWTTPTTHSSGDTLAVTDWNNVANNETFLYQAPYAAYYNSGVTSVPNTTFTQITLGGFSFSGYGFAVTSNNIIVPLTGIYHVYAAYGSVGTSGEVQGAIYQNGSVALSGNTAVAVAAGGLSTAAGLVKCTAGGGTGQLGLYGYQASGGTVNSITGANVTYLHAAFLGSA